MKQEHKKDRGHLGERVRLAENAGPKLAQTGDRIEHSADSEDGNVPAEHHHGELPGNLVQYRQHEKHGTHEELVGDGIEILTEQCLLFELAGEQPVEAVADCRQHEQRQRP